MKAASPHGRRARKLMRLGFIAGLAGAALPPPADPSAANGNEVSSVGGAGTGADNVVTSRHARPYARRCDPPPCPARPNAAPFKNEGRR
jgi:hypothetical protein